MRRIDILRDLFDEKIIKITSLFLEEPEKPFSLTQTASSANVNVATTMRILDKLVKKEILELIVMGKSKFYKLKQSEKTLALNKLLKREEHLTEFLDRIKQHPRVRKLILESKTADSAKLLIVGEYLPTEGINSLIDEIRRKYNFIIQFVIISEKQFEQMEKQGFYDIGKKILWSR